MSPAEQMQVAQDKALAKRRAELMRQIDAKGAGSELLELLKIERTPCKYYLELISK